MKVLYDCQIFNSQKVGGISRYFAELAGALPDDIDPHFAVRRSRSIYLEQLGIATMPNVPFKRYILKAVNYARSRRLLERGDYDVFHPTYYNPYYIPLVKHPTVVTVHDMIHERFPGNFTPGDTTAEVKRQTVEHADRIIAISESTRRDILDLYDIDPAKISVVYHGRNILSDAGAEINGLPEHYILFVGGRPRYKNFERLVKAFAEVRRVHPDVKLICTGAPFKKGEQEMIVAAGLRPGDDVRHIFVSDPQLRRLYAGALCFVFPSLYEGFGFPVLEAFDAGCPAVLSDRSSLPEIGGDGALYFDPEDIGDMRDRILECIDSQTLRDSLISRGHARADLFSWKRTAEQTAEIYRSLV